MSCACPERHLVIPEDALLDDGKLSLRAAHAIVVVADRGEAAFLRAVGHHRHQRAAELQAVQHLRQDEGGAGEIRLPAKRPVELGRVANALMDGQEEIGRVDDNVVLARLDGLGGKLLPRLRRRQRRLRLAVIGGHILPACRTRRVAGCPAWRTGRSAYRWP